MLDLYEKMETAAAVVRQRWNRRPHAGIILGTGLGNVVERVVVA